MMEFIELQKHKKYFIRKIIADPQKISPIKLFKPFTMPLSIDQFF